MAPIPITIITGFLGSGKTTLILNLIPQLPRDYRLALLKNEFGDVAIDSQLATASSISGVKELLNGCICCNLVGQLGDALETLRNDVKPDRIIIETSGSAFPATLAMEVNRLGRETGNFSLDGVIVVIDVENWYVSVEIFSVACRFIIYHNRVMATPTPTLRIVPSQETLTRSSTLIGKATRTPATQRKCKQGILTLSFSTNGSLSTRGDTRTAWIALGTSNFKLPM